jgi:ubiquinone/menaquinone biosynthesis C-methylase UbiE
MSNATTTETQTWEADFFGGLNAMPDEAVTGIGHILEAMNDEPAFHDARRALVQDLGLREGDAVLEAGCGTGVALADLRAVVGPHGQIQGIDPTLAFVKAAQRRAMQADVQNASYATGDIRALPGAANRFDAVFCDKVLIHAGPTAAALAEMVRVTRPGGRVGAVEWLPYFALSSTKPALVARLNGMFHEALYAYDVSANLARHFRAAGLTEVRTRAFLATTDSLDARPFWRAFLVAQMPMFVHAGMLAAEEAEPLVADLEELNRRGAFSASFIVQTAVGTKTA